MNDSILVRYVVLQNMIQSVIFNYTFKQSFHQYLSAIISPSISLDDLMSIKETLVSNLPPCRTLLSLKTLADIIQSTPTIYFNSTNPFLFHIHPSSRHDKAIRPGDNQQGASMDTTYLIQCGVGDNFVLLCSDVEIEKDYKKFIESSLLDDQHLQTTTYTRTQERSLNKIIIENSSQLSSQFSFHLLPLLLLNRGSSSNNNNNSESGEGQKENISQIFKQICCREK